MMKNKLMRVTLLIVMASLLLIFIYNERSPASTSKSKSTETTISDENVEQLTISDENGESFSLFVKDIPLFQDYLDTQENRKNEIERTQFTILDAAQGTKYVLLQYSCGNKLCDTLLIKVSDSNVESLALVNGIFQDYKISTDNGKALLRYGYNEGDLVVRHILIAIDLVQLKIIPHPSTEQAKAYMDTDSPTWPILDYNWLDNKRFVIKSADLRSSDFQAIKEWYASAAQNTKNIEISLQDH